MVFSRVKSVSTNIMKSTMVKSSMSSPWKKSRMNPAERQLNPDARRSFRDMREPPIAKLLGYKLTSLEPGQAVIELDATSHHRNPFGIIHGGVICTIADAAMATAYAALLRPEETFATLELKVNFLKPVRNARLRAVGKVLEKGRSVGLAQCDVIDKSQRVIAHATSSFMRLGGRSTKRRTLIAGQLQLEKRKFVAG